MLTSTAPTSWWVRSSFTCSQGRSTRKGAYECTTGRMPSRAMPAATEINSCSRMPTLTTRSRMPRRRTDLLEAGHADVRQHERDPRIMVERLGDHAGESLAHDAHAVSTTATTTWGRPGAITANAPSSAPWSRPDTVRALQPSTVNLPSIPPGQPCVADRLSTTTASQIVQAEPAGERDRLVVRALVELGVPDQADDAGRARPCARSASATPTARGRP